MAHNTKTPVMVLQELTIKKKYSPPDYNIIYQQMGTHENRFDFMVKVAGVQASGSGSSKQIAKHQAAHNALLQLQELGIYNPSEDPVGAFKVPLNGNNSFTVAPNCIVDLQTICVENKIPPPDFHEISSVGPPHNKEFTYECKISSITTEAKASTKKMAKQLAAKEMLERIKQVLPDLVTEQKNLHKKITNEDNEALAKYQDLREIIPDKSIKIDEVPDALAKLMAFKNLKYENFLEDLSKPSEDSLKNILDILEVTYSIQQFQVSPPMVILSIKLDTPFTVLDFGNTSEEARKKVIAQTFKILDTYMQIKL